MLTRLWLYTVAFAFLALPDLLLAVESSFFRIRRSVSSLVHRPADRVQILRKAFTDTLKDQEFLAQVKKLNFAVDPISGEELEGIIHGLFKIKPETLAKLKEILN